jgi:hypothetical protein
MSVLAWVGFVEVVGSSGRKVNAIAPAIQCRRSARALGCRRRT